jgi:NTP pyrophosphatase (non-canonical NTP hydrolase)
VTIREFQEWTRQRDQATGWDAISPLQLMVHLTEEVGEVAQAINRIYEYRDDTAQKYRASLGTELVDLIWFVAKLASRYGVDLEAQVRAMVERAESRAPDHYRYQLAAAIESLEADAVHSRRTAKRNG